ncbi:MAG TPA: hypothetical protein VKF59_01050 [Candidatus Dormibacteraeota bacterium]|nr:hypothetical protein [Candidatus Dormibacteraeota bacterium]
MTEEQTEVATKRHRWPAGRPRFQALWRSIAWKLPAPLVYWCALRVVAHATTGAHARQVVPELLAMDAIGRWEDSRGGDPRHGCGRLVDVS